MTQHGGGRVGGWLAWGVACGVAWCLGAAAWAGPQDGRLEIYWIDVEGGAATLVVTPAGETVLVDTGNPGRRDADRIVKVVTQVAGRRRIDHLVTTHFHGDHYGGAAVLAGLLPIGTVYDNGEFEGMPDRPDPTYWKFACERRVVWRPNDVLPLKQSPAGDGVPLAIRCLGGRQQFIAAPAGVLENTAVCAQLRTKERDGSDNANSLVLLLSFGPFRFFDAGDLTWNQEARLVCPQNLVGTVDVYQVTHHGLDASNNPVVLQTLQPRVAVMNNGTTKGCLPEVFTALGATPSLQALYQVHKNLRPDGATHNAPDEYIANRERECQGNFIRLSVDPQGRTYVVSIPAHGHTRTFETVAR